MFDVEKIRAKIERVAMDEMDRPPEEAREIAFHMTDWLADLNRTSGSVKIQTSPAQQR